MSFFAVALALTDAASAASSKACSQPLQTSCQNTTSVDSCCLLAPGGQLLQTQFWDTGDGPSDSWTIHGLWPDNCDGSFLESCDASRAYNDIQSILQQSSGGQDLVDYMSTYWVNINGDNPELWQHEWAEHGTCVSTLDPSCFDNYQTGDEVPIYFNKVVELFKSLDTYTLLSQAGITPSTSQTYALSDIEAALSAGHDNKQIIVRCEHGNTLSRARYAFNVQGPFQNGTFIAVDWNGESGNCPKTVKYPPKTVGGSSQRDEL